MLKLFQPQEWSINKTLVLRRERLHQKRQIKVGMPLGLYFAINILNNHLRDIFLLQMFKKTNTKNCILKILFVKIITSGIPVQNQRRRQNIKNISEAGLLLVHCFENQYFFNINIVVCFSNNCNQKAFQGIFDKNH